MEFIIKIFEIFLLQVVSWLQVPFDNNSLKLKLKMKIINIHRAEFLSLNFYLIIIDKELEEPLVIPTYKYT